MFLDVIDKCGAVIAIAITVYAIALVIKEIFELYF